MGTPLLPADFKEFLRSLNEKKVEYLLIGGYAVGYYGSERVVDIIDEVEVPIISLRHLKINKRASGRLKDLSDLKHLP